MLGQGFSRVVAPSSGWRLPRRGEENLFVTRPMSELGHLRLPRFRLGYASHDRNPSESGHKFTAPTNRCDDARSSTSVTEEYDHARQWKSIFRASPLNALEQGQADNLQRFPVMLNHGHCRA